MASILIIDDDQQVRGLVREAFEGIGFSVSEAGDGFEGIEQYRQSPSDLVILDILMPEKEGLETILDLRREFPGVKILAVSGGSERAHVNLLDLAKRLGASHTIKKPFEIQSLLDLANSLIKEEQ